MIPPQGIMTVFCYLFMPLSSLSGPGTKLGPWGSRAWVLTNPADYAIFVGMKTYDDIRRHFRLRAAIRKYGLAAPYTLARLEAGRPYHWTKAYENIKARCINPHAHGYRYYGGRGIKCLISSALLRTAFIRDQAWTLARPSVDRIDNDGHYTYDNIRWIEMKLNKSRGSWKIVKKADFMCWLADKGLTLEMFVFKAGLKYPTVSRWLYARARPRDPSRRKIGQVYPDCPIALR